MRTHEPWVQHIGPLAVTDILRGLGGCTESPIHGGEIHQLLGAHGEQFLPYRGYLARHRDELVGLKVIRIDACWLLRDPHIFDQVPRRRIISFIEGALIRGHPVAHHHFLHVQLLMVLLLKFFERCVALFHLDLLEIVFSDVLEVLSRPLVLVLHLGEFKINAGVHGTGLIGNEELFLGEASTLLVH